jgi:hypothetical protein
MLYGRCLRSCIGQSGTIVGTQNKRRTVMKNKAKQVAQEKQAPVSKPNRKSGNGFIQKAAGL